jgi:multicomponent K+:H+ antiporter subunit F
MTTLFGYAVAFASLCFVLGMSISLVRLFLGPSAQDRVLAFDSIYINGLLTLLMLGIRSGAGIYFDLAVLMALFGFVSTVAFAKFLLRGEVIEP